MSAPSPILAGCCAFGLAVVAGLLALRPSPAAAAAPAPAVVTIDLAQPGHFQLGDDRLRVTVAVDPARTVPDWWWDHNGGVVAIALAGQELLTARGMPERWDLDEPKALSPDLRLQVGQGWVRRDQPMLPAERSARLEDGALICVATLPLQAGVAYRMERIIRVDPAAAALSIELRVANTGERPLTLRHFSHAYWNLGGGPIDADYRLETSLRPRPADTLWQEAAGGLRIVGPIAKSVIAQAVEQPPSLAAQWRLINDRTGLTVAAVGDFEPHLFALYAEPTAIVPEVTVRRTIAPGETTRWRRTWTFSREP